MAIKHDNSAMILCTSDIDTTNTKRETDKTIKLDISYLLNGVSPYDNSIMGAINMFNFAPRTIVHIQKLCSPID